MALNLATRNKAAEFPRKKPEHFVLLKIVGVIGPAKTSYIASTTFISWWSFLDGLHTKLRSKI